MSARIDQRDVYHVIPVQDLIEHECDGLNCKCHPRIHEEENGFMVVHNSLDHRELLET